MSTFYEDLNHAIPALVRIRNEYRQEREEWKHYFSKHVVEQINEDVAYRIGMVKYLECELDFYQHIHHPNNQK